jgi:hypothetical protein
MQRCLTKLTAVIARNSFSPVRSRTIHKTEDGWQKEQEENRKKKMSKGIAREINRE